MSADEARLENTRLAQRQTWEALGVLVVAEGPVDAAADPVFEIPAEIGEPTWRSARPDLIAQGTLIRAAERIVRDSSKDVVPSATLSFDPQYVTPAGLFQPSRTWRLTFSVTQPIFQGGLQRAAKREREVVLDASRLALTELEVRARSEVRVARAAVASLARSVLTCTPISSASTGKGRSACSSRCVASARARAMTWGGVARRPASHVRYDSGDTPSIAANAACDWPSAIRHARSVRGSTRRCCVNRNWHRALPRVGSSPIDRERLWSTKLGHSIEHVARKHRFDSLRCASPTSKSIAENRLVPEERVLDAGLSMIADLLLPSTAPNLADPSDRPIAAQSRLTPAA